MTEFVAESANAVNLFAIATIKLVEHEIFIHLCPIEVQGSRTIVEVVVVRG